MSLLAILISLLLEKLLPPLHGLAVLPGLSLIISGCTHDWPAIKMGSFVHALHAWQNTPFEEADTNDDTAPQSHRLLLRIGQASLQFGNHPPQDGSQHNDAIRETLGLAGVVWWRG